MDPQKTSSTTPLGVSEQKPLGSGTDRGDTTLSAAVATLRKRRWIVILAATLGVFYGAYKAFTQPRLYLAQSTIQVNSGASNEYRVEQAFDDYDDTETKMNTEVMILESDTLLEQVALEMDLTNNPDFLGAKGPVDHKSLSDPLVRDSVLKRLRDGLRVSLVPRTKMIIISYESLSAQLSADIVNRVVFDYIQRSFQTPVARTKMVSEFLSNNLSALKTDVERSQQEILGLQRKMGILGPDSAHNEIQSSVESLLTAESAARIARIEAESRYRMIASMDMNTLEGPIETTPGISPLELNVLRGQLATAKAQYSQLGFALGPRNPQMVALQLQIDQITREIRVEQDRLELQAKEVFLAAKAADDRIEQEVEARRNEAFKQADNLVLYGVLQGEYEQNRQLYEALRQRLETAKVESGLDATEVDQVDKAVPPVNPTREPRSRVILTMGVAFLLGGIVIAFIVESLDSGVAGIQEIEAILGLPFLALIPKERRSTNQQTAAKTVAQRNISVLSDPKSQFAESFRSLRTSILLARTGKPPKIILLTSATPSEGKTTTAINLASVLAQEDKKVLLIDADLRRPSVHHRFGIPGRVGLSSVLAGAVKFEDAVQHVPGFPNISVLPSGPVPPYPAEMLNSNTMRDLLHNVGETYSHIVIDSPPVLSVTDAAVLASMSDAVIVVIRHGKTNRNVMRNCRDLLLRTGAPIAGLVLNAVDLSSTQYYGYTGYTGYNYGSMDADSWEPTSPPEPNTEK